LKQLANQFVASIFWVSKHHQLRKLSPNDQIKQENKTDADSEPPQPSDGIVDAESSSQKTSLLTPFAVDPLPENVFKAGQNELAEDLVVTEQKIELLISMLPGLENSERDQEQMIRQLEEELKISEEERKEALKEKEAVLERLESVIRNIRRP